VAILVALSCVSAFAVDSASSVDRVSVHSIPRQSGPLADEQRGRPGHTQSLIPFTLQSDAYQLKLAYGRTFGTCTALDYATLELSRGFAELPARTRWGSAKAELQFSLLGSYVVYDGGKVEHIKRLQFDDGYEVSCLPKGRISLPAGALGLTPYMESGAGIGYVSETYRNSGSRWNWSLLAGMGIDRKLASRSDLSLGIQWRHLSNGNMWGRGDELHHANSGTDMLQGLLTVIHRF
jgi:opacity protein-like surface antigen